MCQSLFRGHPHGFLVVVVMATLSVYYSNVCGYNQGFSELCAPCCCCAQILLCLLKCIWQMNHTTRDLWASIPSDVRQGGTTVLVSHFETFTKTLYLLFELCLLCALWMLKCMIY